MDSTKDEAKHLINDEDESLEQIDEPRISADGDDFEDAIEPPVEEKENDSENDEKIIETVTQQMLSDKSKAKHEGDSDQFRSFDDANSELRFLNGDEEQIIREIKEDRGDNPISDTSPKNLESEVSNLEEKVEAADSVHDEIPNGEEDAGTSEETSGRDTDHILGKAEVVQNDEVKSNVEVPPEKIIQEARDTENGVEAYDGDRDIVANEGVGVNGNDVMLTDPVAVESGEVNGETQSNSEISRNEELIEEVSEKDIGTITVTSDETRNGEVQSHEEEVSQKENGDQNGELQSYEEAVEESTENGDHEDIHSTKLMSDGTDLVSMAEKYMKTYEDESVNSNANVTDESFTSNTNGSHENPVNESSVQNNEADNVTESIDRGQFDESPVVEDASDSNSSDNDENHTDTLPQAAAEPAAVATAPVPQTPPALPKPKASGSPAPPPSKPAGLGSASLPDPSSTRPPQHVPNGRSGAQQQRQSQPSDEAITDEVGEHDEIRQKLQNIRVKFLRLVHRLGQTPHNTVVAQVLYRIGLAEQLRRNSNRPVVVGFDRASILAEQLELSGDEPLDFSCTVMLLGKAGVGKSSTLNSLFNESLVPVHTFGPGTRSVQEISGVIQGINVKIIDTPGLSTSSSDMQKNEKILYSVKKYVKNNPPDIVLYFDRLDVQNRDYGDVGLLKTITNVFGSPIWFNAIIVLTHAASAPPDGPNGTPLTYDMFVTQRTHIVQQSIRQAAGDVRLMNPVSLVENHSACRMNRSGKRVLPNGTVWEPQLLLLSFASKILGEANALLKLEDSAPYNRTFSRRSPPLPYFLSSLLQSRAPVKLPEEEQFGEEDELVNESDGESDSDDGSDYDDLPPFRRLTKAQLSKLSKQQRKAYDDEIEYREKLFFKKQLKEERKRRKMAKKFAQAQQKDSNFDTGEKIEGDEMGGGPASIPVPMPDMALPASFDSDAPVHRYRYLDSSNQWLVRPVLDLHGWDHDIGYEGLNLERLFVVKNKLPVSLSGQLTKDKKECSLQLDVSSSLKHGEGKSSSLGFDLQSVGKDISYTVRGETRFRNLKRNDTSAGVSVNMLGDSVSAGVKLEDKLVVNKRLKMLVSGGVMTGRGEMASGGRVEVTWKDKDDYPIGRMLSTLALSVVDWHGELALGLNCQSQVPIGRGTNMVVHGNVSNKGSGQVGIRVNSSEQFQIALVALIPLLGHIKRVLLGTVFE